MNKTDPIFENVPASPFRRDGEASPKSKEEAWKAAKKFEGYFMGFIYQKAMDAIPKSEDLGSPLNQEIYQNFFADALSKQVENSPRGLGLAEMIVGERKAPVSMPSLTRDFKPVQAPVLDDPEFYLPAARVTSVFGYRSDPVQGDKRFHSGIDFAYPHRTPIQAAADGEVVFSGRKGGYGNTVLIKHADGYTSLYAHADENLVKVGTKVKKGDVIALSGSTGKSTGPHLHFELKKDGIAVDPKKVINFKNNT